MKLTALLALLLVVAPLGLSAGAQEAPKDPPKEPAKEASKEAPKEAKDDKKEEKKEPAKPKNIDETVKDWEKLPGLWTMYRKLEGNKQKLMLELTEEQLGKMYILQMTSSSGNGRVSAGSPLIDVVLQWEKTPDDRLLLVSPNLTYRVKKDSAQAAAVEREFPATTVEVFTIAAKQEDRKSLLLDVSDFFRANIPGAGKLFDTGDFGITIDGGKSYIESIKNLPENLVVQVNYNTGSRTPGGAKSAPLRVNYNLFTLPENGYVPRLADARVGYFVNGYLSTGRSGFDTFDDDTKNDPRVVYINRWKLEKADPNAAISLPKKPIVFWIDKAWPKEYRAAASEGILLWNKAFERVGFKDAIVVKQMPDDADWDHADLRYNVLRWVTTPPSAYSAMAVALMRENPLTGEILGANINCNSNWMRFARAQVKDTVNPALNPKAQETAQGNLVGNPTGNHPAACDYGEGLMEQAWTGWQALEMLQAAQLGGSATAGRVKVDETEFANNQLRILIAHEMGHCLGLRHNFIASTLYDANQLAEEKNIADTGLTASVMDYTGFNVYGLKKQGVDLFSTKIGPYDMWAIEYGYKPTGEKSPEAELPAIKAIAARCNEPGLAYQSDELADGYDPSIVRYDLGRDPLDYMEKSFQLNRELLATLGERLPKKGEDYSEFTNSFYRLLFGNGSRASQAARYIGGLNAVRNTRGEINEKPLLQPVAASEQRRALNLINKYVFAEDAFAIPADYYKKLAPDPFNLGDMRARMAFPVRDQIASLQSSILQTLFEPSRLNRMEENEFKTPDAKGLSLLELFRSVQNTVWSELAKENAAGKALGISALHRDLQRSHIDLLISLASQRGDSDTRMLAWDTLRRLKADIAKARKGELEAYTRLHLDQSQMRIERALDAKVTASAL